MTPPRTVAVLGAGGTMGLPMARNLARAGLAVRAWNRTAEKARPLADDGATLCDTPHEAATGADVVLTILTDADAVLEVADGDGGALAAAGADAVWLQMSTIGVDGAARCLQVADRHGIALVDAPVLGTKAPAEAGELVVLASGDQALRDTVAPVLDAVGRTTLWVGDAGAGSRLKVAVNAWLLSVVEGAAEALALAEGLHLDPRLLLDAVAGGPLDLPYLRLKGQAMIDRDFPPSFSLALAAKDAGLADDAARAAGMDLPLLTTIRERLAQGAREHGDEDMAATFRTSARTLDATYGTDGLEH